MMPNDDPNTPATSPSDITPNPDTAATVPGPDETQVSTPVVDPAVASTSPGNDPANAPGPLADVTDPTPATDTTTAPPAQPGSATSAQAAPAVFAPAGGVTVAGPDAAPDPQPGSSFRGPSVGEVVGYTDFDPYDDAEITRYGVVVGQHPRDPNVEGSRDRAEIAWLPQGTAVLDVADLDQI